MTVHQIIYLCHTFIIQLHLSQIHPTKMKSKFENPHQTKQKLILQPPNSTPHKKQLHTPQKNKRFKAQNLNIFSLRSYKKQFKNSSSLQPSPTYTYIQRSIQNPKSQIFFLTAPTKTISKISSISLHKPHKTTKPKTQIFPTHSLKNNYCKNLKTITIPHALKFH